ncbi:hypothetical protein BGZ73_008343 [Actinomortierella ambigua]|nr:hypothetical protein BGZ73_008343 [Actinomortierella ambigua]
MLVWDPISAQWIEETLSDTVTQSLTFLDLRFTSVSDQLILSLAKHYQNTYSITDRALSYLVAAQQGLRLVHVENHREISHDHELVEMLRALAVHHGSTLETLVLKTHDFQNCDLAQLGMACRQLRKFAAPGGMHLMRDQVLKLTEACKLTLEHLDFSSSDIETGTLANILKSLGGASANSGNNGDEQQQQQQQQQQVAPVRGKLKSMVLMGMEDTLNQETCAAIGDYAGGLECFRLDILESEAKDVAQMLSKDCGRNLRVLTLGCHEVCSELANDILEQIAANCRMLEILDINHWTFSNSALEKVLRKCRLLRYLNVSYTGIDEQAVEIICECLGEVKLPPPDSATSLSKPMLVFEDEDEAAIEGHESATSKVKAKERAVADDIAQADRPSQLQQPHQRLPSMLSEQEALAVHDQMDQPLPPLPEEWLQWCALDSELVLDNDNQHSHTRTPLSTLASLAAAHETISNNTKSSKEEEEGEKEELLEFDMEMDETTGMDLDMSLDMHRYRSNKLQFCNQRDHSDTLDMLDEDESISSIAEDYSNGDGDINDSDDDIQATALPVHCSTHAVDIQRDIKGKGLSVDSSGGSHHLYPGYSSVSSASGSSSSVTFSCTVSTPASSVGSSSSASASSSSWSLSCLAGLYTTVTPSAAPTLTTSPTANDLTCSTVDGSSELQCNNSTHSSTSELDAQSTPLLPSLPIPLAPYHHHNLAHQLSTTSLQDETRSSTMNDSSTVVEKAPEEALNPTITTTKAIKNGSSNVGGDADTNDGQGKSGRARGPFYSRLEQVNLECCSHVSLASENKIKALMAMKQEALRDPTRSFWASTWVSTIPVASSVASSRPSTSSSSSPSPSPSCSPMVSGSSSNTNSSLILISATEDTMAGTPPAGSTSSESDHLRMHAAAIGAAAAAAKAGSSSTLTATTLTTTSFVMQGHKTTKVWAENEHDMMMTRLAMERDSLLEAVVKWEQEQEAALVA